MCASDMLIRYFIRSEMLTDTIIFIIVSEFLILYKILFFLFSHGEQRYTNISFVQHCSFNIYLVKLKFITVLLLLPELHKTLGMYLVRPLLFLS